MQMNQFLGSLALLPIEKILNGIAARDSYIAEQFSAFDSKCIEILSQRPDFSLSVRFEDNTIRLSAIDTETLGITADATISGKAENLLALLAQKSNQRALADSSIDISGDATLVQDLHVTIQTLDIDWQDYLAPIIGDVLSHELGQMERNAKHWGMSAGASMERSVRDYLTEEARLVPGRLEVESFTDRLDQLRLRLDRAAARSDLLERRYSLLFETK